MVVVVVVVWKTRGVKAVVGVEFIAPLDTI